MKEIYLKDHMRRRLARYSKFNISGLFKTRKGKCGENWLFFESYLEKDFFTKFEFDPKILMIESQPISISYSWQGKTCYYTADVGLVNVSNHKVETLYVEIKHSSAMEDKVTERKFKKIRQVFRKLGYQFEVFTEKNLLCEQSLHNLEIINKSIGYIDKSSPLIDDALTALPSQVTLKEATEALDALKMDTSVLSYLLHKQLYLFDLSKPMRANTILDRNIH